MVFQALPPCVLQKMPEKPLIWPVSLGFFGLYDLEICHMTLKIWEPKAVGVSNHLIKYQGNRWWNMLAKAGTDRQTDMQTDGRTVCRSEEWHTLHTITPNKWPKHKRKNLRKIVCVGRWVSVHDDVIKWKHFCVSGPLYGEFTGDRCIPRTKASDAELWQGVQPWALTKFPDFSLTFPWPFCGFPRPWDILSAFDYCLNTNFASDLTNHSPKVAIRK